MTIRLHNRPGVVTTMTVLGVTAVVMSAFLTLSVLSTSQLTQGQSLEASEQTFFAAESGINHALNRLKTNGTPDTYSLIVNDANISVDIEIDPSDLVGKRRIIT